MSEPTSETPMTQERAREISYDIIKAAFTDLIKKGSTFDEAVNEARDGILMLARDFKISHEEALGLVNFIAQDVEQNAT